LEQLNELSENKLNLIVEITDLKPKEFEIGSNIVF
jgi:hypothetical protein